MSKKVSLLSLYGICLIFPLEYYSTKALITKPSKFKKKKQKYLKKKNAKKNIKKPREVKDLLIF